MDESLSVMNIEMGDNQLRNALLSPIKEVSSSDQTPSTMRNILEATTDGNGDSMGNSPTESPFQPVPIYCSDDEQMTANFEARHSSNCFYVKNCKNGEE